MSLSVTVFDRDDEKTGRVMMIAAATGQALAEEICIVFVKHETNEVLRITCDGSDIQVDDTTPQPWTSSTVFYATFVHTLQQVHEVITSRRLHGFQRFTSNRLIEECMLVLNSEEGRKVFHAEDECHSALAADTQRSPEDILKGIDKVRI